MAAITQHSVQVLNNSTYAHSIGGMPHGLGLLTTVASLPPKYRSRYLILKAKSETPLDLSRKFMSPQLECEVPMAANFTEIYTEPCNDTTSQCTEEIIDDLVKQCQTITDDNAATTISTTTTTATPITKQQQHQQQQQQQRQQHQERKQMQQHVNPITPPLTPTKKRKFSETSSEGETHPKENQVKTLKMENENAKQPLIENTPVKPIKILDTAPKTGKSQSSSTGGSNKTNRINKATRKLKFDEETSSPVSGTIIRPLKDITDGSMQYSNGDIDPKYNIVEITEETKAELAAIKNVIGDYVCKLCRIKFDDAFGLAQHRCACIVLLEYRCPECGKQFNCPANLASHRRWHKPRKDGSVANTASASLQNKKENNEQKHNKKSDESESIYGCQECGKRFKRQAYLKKHQMIHQEKNSASNQEEPQNPTEETQHSSASSCTTNSLMQQQTYTITPAMCTSATNSAPQQMMLTKSGQSTCDDQDETMSDYSSSSSCRGYERLQIIETGLTEEENIAAAALTNLRNCASVIQHTTLAH